MLIDFIDGAYEGWVLLYKLRRHSFAVKARLNNIKKLGNSKSTSNSSVANYIGSALSVTTYNQQASIQRQVKAALDVNPISQRRANNAALDSYFQPIRKPNVVIRRKTWERDRCESANFMWDSCYSMMRQFGWSIDEEWTRSNSVRLKHEDYPMVNPLLLFLSDYPDDCDLVQAIRQFVTKPVA